MRILRRWLQLIIRSWHSLLYVALSLPHTAVSSDVTMTSQCVRQRHIALPVLLSTTHSAPNAQNLRSHDSDEHSSAATVTNSQQAQEQEQQQEQDKKNKKNTQDN